MNFKFKLPKIKMTHKLKLFIFISIEMIAIITIFLLILFCFQAETALRRKRNKDGTAFLILFACQVLLFPWCASYLLVLIDLMPFLEMRKVICPSLSVR